MAFFSKPDKPVEGTFDGETFLLLPKTFKSKSVGWYYGNKMMVQGLRCQVSISIVVVGSKPPAELIDVDTVEKLSLTPWEGNNGVFPASEPEKGKRTPKPKKEQ